MIFINIILDDLFATPVCSNLQGNHVKYSIVGGGDGKLHLKTWLTVQYILELAVQYFRKSAPSELGQIDMYLASDIGK